MKRLPNEILQKIFLHLHQQEKVECMLTCQLWSRLIKSHCLFNTIQLSEMSNWTELIERRLSSAHRSQVTSLILNFYLEGDLDYLFSYFPKLCVFYVLGCHNPTSSSEMKKKKKKENYHLEQLVESFSHRLTYQLLSSCSVYRHLKTLNVKASTYHLSPAPLISLLADHAPNVLHLALESFSISFQHVESLHTSLSSLQSIKLISSTLKLDDTIHEDSNRILIIPAPSVTLFSFDTLGSSPRLLHEWLYYIYSKYTHLTNLTLTYPVSHEQDQPYTHSDGFGNSLKSLSLNLKGTNHPLTLFDKCQLKHLHLHHGPLFTTALQHQPHIHTLHVESLPPSDFTWLKSLPHLRELTLTKATSLHLNTLLATGITSLFIHNSPGMTIDLSDPTVYPSIHTLGFFYQELPHHTDTLLSRRCPTLNTLSLVHCGVKSFHLPTHRLGRLTLAEGVLFKETYLLLITDGGRRWYVAKQYFTQYQHLEEQRVGGVHLAARSMSVEEDMVPTVMVKCGHVNQLYVFR